MKYKFFAVISLISLTLMFVMGGCSRETKNKIVVKGSTTVLPIAQRAAEAYSKISKVSISVEGSGSGNGIKALIDGIADIATSSRAMHEKEIKAAIAKGIKTKEIIIAYDMIVPVVNPGNRVSNLTLDQLKAIYDGSVSNWKQVGGEDAKIVVISRDTSSGTYEVWNDKVMLKADVRKDALLQASNGAIVSAIAGNKKAIGYVGFGYINKTIKPVRVNGVEGTIENGKSKKFPISRELFMFINEGRVTQQTKGFIDFILSSEGQRLVKEDGFIPIN